MDSYDVIVVGLGAMGSAATRELARRGRRVLALDQFSPPHRLGSSHGRTRIIREAYFEDPVYVPLIQRAYQAWAELEQEAGQPLLLQTGGLMIGPATGMVVDGARRSAREHSLAHEELTAAEIRRRFPALQPDDDMVGLLEPRAGLLSIEACLEAFLAGARAHRAELRMEEAVRKWSPDGAGVTLTTDRGTYRGAQLLLTAGAWLPGLLGDRDASIAARLEVERQLFHWFEPARDADLLRVGRCPIVLWEYAPDRVFATFPDAGDGVKAGVHHEGEITDPDRVRREPTVEDEAIVRGLLRRFVPAADGPLRDERVCLYTNTPDHHFLIDFHPGHPQVLIASPCSGHGFKFASVIGEVLADLLITGSSRFDLRTFALDRLL